MMNLKGVYTMRERIKVKLCDEFVNEITLPAMHVDFQRGFEAMILLNKVYAIMLAKQEIIAESDAKQILAGLAYTQETLTEDKLDPQLEGLFFNIEKTMMEKTGPVGGKLQTGRSRNDFHATLLRMEVRDSIWPLLERLLKFQDIVLQTAEENKETVITGYTHFQPGQPITYGHYLTAMSSAFTRDFERIKAAYVNTNQSPYGTAAFAGSSFPVDRQFLSDLLGFDSVLESSLDSIGSRDYIVELDAAYALMALNVSRFSEDLYIWATHEFGTLDFGGEISICSSIMPQKKNPCTLEFARGKAGHSIGVLMSAISSLKNAPYTNNGDGHSAIGLYWDGLANTMTALGMLMITIKHSKINKERAYENTATNYCTVTNLADFMVKEYGISFKQAHDIVGNAVGILDEKKLGIRDIDSKMMKQCCKDLLGYELEISDEQIVSVLEPFNNIQGKVTVGGPSVSSVTDMIAHLKAKVADQKAWAAAAQQQVEQAYARLAEEEKNIVG